MIHFQFHDFNPYSFFIEFFCYRWVLNFQIIKINSCGMNQESLGNFGINFPCIINISCGDEFKKE